MAALELNILCATIQSRIKYINIWTQKSNHMKYIMIVEHVHLLSESSDAKN